MGRGPKGKGDASESGLDVGAVKTELVLAIYEVGQSFFRGWGVEKDKKMGVVRPLRGGFLYFYSHEVVGTDCGW